MKSELSNSIINSIVIITKDETESLHKLVLENRLEDIKKILETTASHDLRDYVNALDGENEITPMAGAVGLGHYEIVKLLISCGADANKKTIAGWNALHFAVAALDQTISDGKNPENNILILNLLLEANADINENICGFSPLTLAVESNISPDIIKHMLLRNNISEPVKNDALNKATEFGKIEIIKLLLEHGGNPHEVDYKKPTFFHPSIAEQVKSEAVGLIEKFLYPQKTAEILEDSPDTKETKRIKYDLLHNEGLLKIIKNGKGNILSRFEPEEGFYSLSPDERVKKLAEENIPDYVNNESIRETIEDLIWQLVRGIERFEHDNDY